MCASTNKNQSKNKEEEEKKLIPFIVYLLSLFAFVK